MLTIPLQALHISAGIACCGLVFSALPSGRGTAVSQLRRVSNRALTAVLVLIATGIMAAWVAAGECNAT